MLPRLTYLGVTNAFALLRLLPMSDHDKDTEILVLRHQITVLQRQLAPDTVRFAAPDRAFLAALLHRLPGPRCMSCADEVFGNRRVRAPSVSVMVKRLRRDRLVEPEQPDRPEPRLLRLTEPGQRAALRVLRRHRLLETFLARTLGLGWDEVHAEAELLEHACSDALERRIDEALGHPSHDPHGDPIPPREGPHDETWGWRCAPPRRDRGFGSGASATETAPRCVTWASSG